MIFSEERNTPGPASVKKGFRPHSAPDHGTRTQHQPMLRPQSALQDKLGTELERRCRRIAALEKKLEDARRSEDNVRRTASGKLQHQQDGHLHRLDGWVVLDDVEGDAIEGISLTRRMEQIAVDRHRRRHVPRAPPGLPGRAQHDPSFARKGHQQWSLRTPPAWPQREPDLAVRARLQLAYTMPLAPPRRGPPPPSQTYKPSQHGTRSVIKSTAWRSPPYRKEDVVIPSSADSKGAPLPWVAKHVGPLPTDSTPLGLPSTWPY